MEERDGELSETAFGGDVTAVDEGGDLAPGASVGDYQVERLLGRGGMGAVYLVEHPLIGKRAAVKLLRGSVDQRAVDRLVQEARAVTRIGHRNIVDVVSFGRLHDGRPYIVMEYLDGEPLDRHLEGRRLAIGDALRMVDEVADALAAAHEQGIVHRDLKPANVFLARRPHGPPEVKLLDFGLAKLLHQDSASEVKTAEGVIMGTPAYLAPEQAAGRQITTRTDVYALGVMLFEMLVGSRPFYASSPIEVAYKHLHQPAPRPSALGVELPEVLEDLVARMLAKEPGERPSLNEVRSVVRRLREEPPASAARRRPLRRRAGIVAAVCAMAVAAAVAAWIAAPSVPEDQPAAAPAAVLAAPQPAKEVPGSAPAPAPVVAPPAAEPPAEVSPTTAAEARPARTRRRTGKSRAGTRAASPVPRGAPAAPGSDDAPIDPLSRIRSPR